MKVKRFTETARLPKRAHPTDAGLDVFTDEDAMPLMPFEVRKIRIGIGVRVPAGCMALILTRSSTSLRNVLVHHPPIDDGYVGEISAIVTNLNEEPIQIPSGTKLAQLVVVPVVFEDVEESDDLGESARGTKAFGSSGGGL